MPVEGFIFLVIAASILFWFTQPEVMERNLRRNRERVDEVDRKLFGDTFTKPGDKELLWSIPEICRIQRAIFLALIGTILIYNMFEYPDNLALAVIIFPIIFYLFWVLLKYFDERKDKAKQP